MSHYKPYPAYRPSGVEWIGDVPEHWEVKRLEYVVTTHRENVTPQELEFSEVLHYSIPVVQETGGGVIEDGSTIDSNKLVVRGPQVLISKLNPRKSTVVIADTDPNRLTVASTEFVPLIPQASKSTLPFIASLVVSTNFRQLLESKVDSVTKSHQRVLPEDITKTVVAIPSVAEQISIAISIDRETKRIDSLITKKTRSIDLLKEKRQALITHAVTKGLDPSVKMRDSGVEWIGEVPEHWSVSRLGHFASVENGTTPATNNYLFWKNGTIPWLGSGEVNQQIVTQPTKTITELALRQCSLRLLPVDTLIIGMVGQGKTRGLAAILKIEATINQNLAAICTGSKLHPVFLLFVFRAAYEWIREAGRGSDQAAMNCEIIAGFRLGVPGIQEQMAIVFMLSAMNDRIDFLISQTQHSIDLLKERRSAFITAAVTGQIDVRESA